MHYLHYVLEAYFYPNEGMLTDSDLDKMSYAVLQPVKPDVGLAIPPLDRNDIPIALRKTFTKAQYDAALKDFENRATNDYYSEWFWFTRSQQCWVNTWNPTDDKTNLQDYPSPTLTWFQWVEGWLGKVITTNPIFQAFPGRWQAEILATFGMVNLPPFEFSDFQQSKTERIVTALPNALHFRRGVSSLPPSATDPAADTSDRSRTCVSVIWNSKFPSQAKLLILPNRTTASSNEPGGISSIYAMRMTPVPCDLPWNCASWVIRIFSWHRSTAIHTELPVLRCSASPMRYRITNGSLSCKELLIFG